MIRLTMYAGTHSGAGVTTVDAYRGHLIGSLAVAEIDATISETAGLWDGSREASFRVEVLAEPEDADQTADALAAIAVEYCDACSQDEVWIVRDPVAVAKIRADSPTSPAPFAAEPGAWAGGAIAPVGGYGGTDAEPDYADEARMRDMGRLII